MKAIILNYFYHVTPDLPSSARARSTLELMTTILLDG